MKGVLRNIAKSIMRLYAGPWTVSDESRDGHVIYDDGGQKIAIVYGGERNAHLVAGAPGLLATAELYRETGELNKKEGSTPRTVLKLRDAEKALDAAIAKVKPDSINAETVNGVQEDEIEWLGRVNEILLKSLERIEIQLAYKHAPDAEMIKVMLVDARNAIGKAKGECA
jgi:hypothetical protein